MPDEAAPRPAARIAVLVSGQGRNLQALIEACADKRIAGSIVGVLSNRADAPALQRARDAGLDCQVIAHAEYADRETFDSVLAAALDQMQADFVVLAGFMRILTSGFVRRYAGRLVNIHPSLLPLHPGLHTHRKALEAGDMEHGATVHFVTEELDGGAPVIQGRVRVQAEDDADSLAERVMKHVEIRIYPQTLAWLASGALTLRGTHAELHGRALYLPLQLEDLEEDFR